MYSIIMVGNIYQTILNRQDGHVVQANLPADLKRGEMGGFLTVGDVDRDRQIDYYIEGRQGRNTVVLREARFEEAVRRRYRFDLSIREAPATPAELDALKPLLQESSNFADEAFNALNEALAQNQVTLAEDKSEKANREFQMVPHGTTHIFKGHFLIGGDADKRGVIRVAVWKGMSLGLEIALPSKKQTVNIKDPALIDPIRPQLLALTGLQK